MAYGEAVRAAKETGSLAPPAHILNAPTAMMRDLGYGAGYAYDQELTLLLRIASLVPPFSTMVMPIRWAAGEAPLWEVGLAVVLMLVAVVALIRIAGRIYAGAVLRSGPRVKLADALAAGRTPTRPTP